jgi:hypothetical protein
MPPPKSKAPANDAIDTDFYVEPTPSRYWSAFNYAGCRLFINALRRLSANGLVTGQVAFNAMAGGIRSIVRIPSVRLYSTPTDALLLALSL